MLKALCGPILAVCLAVFVGGCASLQRLDAEVSTYGPWPPGRVAAGYVFERLPSQQQRPQTPQILEDAARGALQAAGFRAVDDPARAEYLVQLGARVSTSDPWYYNEPLFWRFGWRYGHGYGPGPGRGYGRWGLGWGVGGWYGWPDPPDFEQEVALVIRDRGTGTLLYEAHATRTGLSAQIEPVLPALFRAALADFPAVRSQPHAVRVDIAPP